MAAGQCHVGNRCGHDRSDRRHCICWHHRDRRPTISDSRSGGEINELALNFRAKDNISPLAVATLAPGVQKDRDTDLDWPLAAVRHIGFNRRYFCPECSPQRPGGRSRSSPPRIVV
jgi:hypothetical protein